MSYASVVDKAVAPERERCAKIAENDPELPRPMPEFLKLLPPEDLARAICRATKKTIAAAIREEL